MKNILLALIATISIGIDLYGQIDLNKVATGAKKVIGENGGNIGKNLSNEDIIAGLKEALNVGSGNAGSSASKKDGYYKNPKIKIPFPPEAIKIKNAVEAVGMKSQVDKFVLTLNRSAEEAAKEAAPIFLNAIKEMTISDGVSILNGGDDAATNFLKDKTTSQLHEKFKPIVNSSLNKVEITKYWNPIIKKYNNLPGVEKMNPDLEEYVTIKALEGLFKLVADEELKIRKDPAARVSDILKKVFGS